MQFYSMALYIAIIKHLNAAMLTLTLHLFLITPRPHKRILSMDITDTQEQSPSLFLMYSFDLSQEDQI